MKRFTVSFLTFGFIMGGILLVPAEAFASVNYNRLIDDFVFSNSSKMSASQIDAFLNTFTNSCISTNKHFAAPDPTGYNPTDGYLYGSNVSAGKVIYDAAQAFSLNPQVLLATLQKEQSLVVGDAGCSTLRYVGAMGYGCPDSGTTHSYTKLDLYTLNGHKVTSVSKTCVNSASKAGFSQQIIHATWLLKFGEQRSLGNTAWSVVKGNWDNSDDPATCYGGPMTQGNRKRCSSDSSTAFYDGFTTIDGSSIHMDTGATAALYWYTPHKSGNANFENIFTGWFGSTLSNPVKLTIIDSSTSETGGTAKVEFSLVSQPTDNVVIPLSISNTAEGTLGSTTSITITPANWNNPSANAVMITGLDDGLANNGDVDYLLLTGSPSSNDAAYDNLIGTDVPNVRLTNFSKDPDMALSGDWNGDKKDTISLRRGSLDLINNKLDSSTDFTYSYGSYIYNNGSPNNAILVGDWNGDGKDTISYKFGNTYYINNSLDGHTDFSFRYGLPTDTALVGDWNGNGKDTISLQRGHRYLINNGLDSSTDFSFNYGLPGDTALVGDWNGNGKDTISLQRGHRYLINNGLDSSTDTSFYYGR